MRHQAAPSFFQRGYCFFTRNAWILLQEVVDSLATFKIVGQGFERNPGATKHRFATENGRVLYDNVVRFQRCRLATTLILTAGKGVSKPQLQPAPEVRHRSGETVFQIERQALSSREIVPRRWRSGFVIAPAYPRRCRGLPGGRA